MDIVKLYRQTVASKRLGSGTSVTKQRYVAGKSPRAMVIRQEGKTTFLSTGISRGNLHGLRKRQGHAITGQQFRAEWRQAKASSSPVIGRYSAAKQREAHYA